jgi:drug/metabolite transporter (DMT)-like permease
VTAIALALGASVLWGVGDFLGGVTSRRLATLTVLAYSQVAGLLGIVFAALFLGEEFLSAVGFVAAVLAGLGGLVGLGALYRGMAVGAMSVVAPISSAAAVVPVVVGLVVGESPGPLQLVGMAIVLTGVALASREPAVGERRLAAGVPLALLAACGFGLYFVLIDPASDEGAAWAVLVARSASTLAAGAVALVRRVGLPGAHDVPLIAIVGVFDVSANVMLTIALTKGFVGLVAVLSSLYPVVTVLLARAILGERIARTQRVGVAVALGGVAAIAAG